MSVNYLTSFYSLYLLSLVFIMFFLDIKMYRFNRSAMMHPMMNYGMGMAPFFKVNY